jgi:soluble lytic murein transglycosylase
MASGHRYRAYVDWRWLALEAPHDAEGDAALAALDEHFPQHPLSADDWKARVEMLSELGRTDGLTAEFEHWAAARGKGPTRADELHYVGSAFYSLRDYPLAAHYLSQSAEQGGPYRTKDAYYAARAFSRIGRQDDAIRWYRFVIERNPKSHSAHLASFRLGREHAFKGHWSEAINAYSHFIDSHAGSDLIETALRERAVSRYATGNFERAAFEFKRLRALRPRSSLASLYLHLEALSLLGTKDAPRAIGLFEAVARDRPTSFPALMARARLAALARPQPALEPAQHPLLSISIPPLVAEFESLGLLREAERLLTRAESTLRVDGVTRFEAECAAHAQLFAGRRNLLLGLSAAAQHDFFAAPNQAPGWVWRCLHPTPFGEWVNSSAQQFGVPRSLIYAIMRQESGFRPDVASPADAHGLMQVIPPTGREIATALDELPEDGNIDLYAPDRSVRYGSYYLGELSKAFGGHPALIAAGYNAGPSAAGLWFAHGETLPLEMFVARIPFDETRGYVINVLSNLAVYQRLDPELGAIDIPLTLR